MPDAAHQPHEAWGSGGKAEPCAALTMARRDRGRKRASVVHELGEAWPEIRGQEFHDCRRHCGKGMRSNLSTVAAGRSATPELVPEKARAAVRTDNSRPIAMAG
jgi:hypothetical protein